MFVLYTFVILVTQTREKWIHTESTINVETLGQKPFSLSICGEDTENTYMDPMPDCRAPKQNQEAKPLRITFYKPLITSQNIRATVCKRLEVTTQTFKNFANSKFQDSQTRVWTKPDPTECEEKKEEKPDQISDSWNYFGEVKPIYKWMQHVTTWLTSLYIRPPP